MHNSTRLDDAKLLGIFKISQSVGLVKLMSIVIGLSYDHTHRVLGNKK